MLRALDIKFSHAQHAFGEPIELQFDYIVFSNYYHECKLSSHLVSVSPSRVLLSQLYPIPNLKRVHPFFSLVWSFLTLKYCTGLNTNSTHQDGTGGQLIFKSVRCPAPVDPDRTARLACPGSSHRNAVSADYKVPRSTNSGHK